MMPFTSQTLALLQSNTKIAQLIKDGTGLAWERAHYTAGGMFQQVVGVFAMIFLSFSQLFGGLLDSANVPGAWGFGIILTAIVVRLLLLPLTAKQIRSMQAMQTLQPVMKEIQRYYPDKLDQNAKMMELYSTYKINPLSGCLPMIVQLPVLFGVYRALYDPFFTGKEFFGVQLLFPVNATGGTSFGFGPELADLIDVTVHTLGLQHLLFHIPTSIPLIGGQFWYTPALPLVALYIASSLLMQRKMKVVNQPSKEFEAAFKEEMKRRNDAPEAPDFSAQMQKQMGFMNIIIIVFAFIFSSGALLYFIVQNVLMMLEYSILPKRGGLTLDVKEMKSFIRRPPPPPVKPGAQQPPAGEKTQKGGASKALAPSSSDLGDDASNPVEDLDTDAEGRDAVAGAPDAASSPRKKKRKKR